MPRKDRKQKQPEGNKLDDAEEKKEEKRSIDLKSLQVSSVLADSYIPKAWRVINEIPVHFTYSFFHQEAEGPPTPLVPFTPACFCEHKHPTIFPRRHVMPELYHVIMNRRNGGTWSPPPIQFPSDRNFVYGKVMKLDMYAAAWERVLTTERFHLLHLFEKYSQYNVALSLKGVNATLSVQGIADFKPPIEVGDIVLVRPMRVEPSVEVQSRVLSVDRSNGGMVTFSWDETFWKTRHPNVKKTRYTVRFIPSTKRMEATLTALDWMKSSAQPALFATLLFPQDQSSPELPQFQPQQYPTQVDWHRLNIPQRTFVSQLMSRTRHPQTDQFVRAPLILTGPAGTGKTGTLLSALHMILHEGQTNGETYRILVCTPSHTACNIITRRLGEHLESDQLFRLMAPDRPVATVPIDILQFTRQDANTGRFIMPVSMSELLNKRVIVCTTTDASLLYNAGLTNLQLMIQRHCFKTYLQHESEQYGLPVTIHHDQGNWPCCHFTHFFLDEAAQATEPEIMIPLSVVLDYLPGSRKVEIALVGDPRQLSPDAYSCSLLRSSLMERLLQRSGDVQMLGQNRVSMTDWISFSMGTDLQLSNFLTINYRGHASFLMMPSVLFYWDKLQAAPAYDTSAEQYWCNRLRQVEKLRDEVTLSLKSEDPQLEYKKQLKWPIHLCTVDGTDVSETLRTAATVNTWYNAQEARQVREIVECLVLKGGVQTNDIGVMAPFRGQVVHIRKLLRDANLAAINVGTIEDFQSVEFPVCILSLTRATPDFVDQDVDQRAGMFRQPKRANVALTRAENLLIVVGNSETMLADPVWKQFLYFCSRNGLHFGELSENHTVSEMMYRVARQSNAGNGEETNDGDVFVLVSSLETTLRM